MARKIKFALEMKDGAKVRSNLEELREQFDLEKAVGYFLSGKLIEWLEDRYYEDEAEKLSAIDKDAPDLRERLCEALGVAYEAGDDDWDVEQLARLNEKKAVLRQKTSDETIIANANKTALTQEDLADLLDMDEPVIYLCGDSFNIPARMENKKYVGVLGTPTIIIKASSQEETDESGIVFENVKLPWTKEGEPATEQTKKCECCGTVLNGSEKFCECCGAELNDNIGATSACRECGAENIATAKFCVECGATLNSSSNAISDDENPQDEGKDELRATIEQFLENINESYLTDWKGNPPILFIQDSFLTEKSKIKAAIRDAAIEYEGILRDSFTEGVDERLQTLQELQEEYDDIFRQSGKAYIEPTPTLQEVRQITMNGHQSLLHSCSGLADSLPSEARFEAFEKIDSWNPFESTDYFLDNNQELSDMADRHYERVASQYDHSDFANAIRSYVRSIKRNLERIKR